jgi:hypothetical protein
MSLSFRAPILCVLLAAIPAIAQQSKPAPPQPEIMPGNFVDITAKAGVHFQGRASHTSKKYLPETMGSGVALFDYDNDGLLDIFFANGAPLADPTPKGTIPQKTGAEYWNRLYHQRKDGTFEDVTEKAGLQGIGYGMGVAVGDYDNDGYEDLYVTAYGGNRLYHNNGNGTFSDVTAQSGTGGSGWSTSAAWVDLDNDGLLDLVALRYVQWDFDDIYCGEHQAGHRAYCHPDVFQPIRALVYHNDGKGHFTEEAAKVGLDKPGKGLGIALADFDRDGKIDIVVANDSMLEFLYRNKGDGTFEDLSFESGYAVNHDGRETATMGIAVGDDRNLGRLDILNTDFSDDYKVLYRNDGDLNFIDSSYEAGVAKDTIPFLSWGDGFMDYDNDGWKDIFIASGHVYKQVDAHDWGTSFAQRPLLLRNMGAGKFTLVPAVQKSGLAIVVPARGAAFGDLFNDGKIDVVLNNLDATPTLLRNVNGDQHHWIEFRLVGGPGKPRDAVGAVIFVTTGKIIQRGDVLSGGSFASSNDLGVHFGLGDATSIDSVEVHWPGGGPTEKITVPGVDRILTIEQGHGVTHEYCPHCPPGKHK